MKRVACREQGKHEAVRQRTMTIGIHLDDRACG